jgi:DNA-binding protein HU-beta
MTKAEVISQIAEDTGIEKVDVQQVVEDSIKNGENIYVRGFGSFIVKKRARKIARNISRNTSIEIPEHFIPHFKPSKQFIDEVKDTIKTGVVA